MTSPERTESIDQFRGIAILSMVVANFINDVEVIPRWIRHSQDIGLGVIDFIAPMFIFAIGLTYGPSFRRRIERDGRRAATGHVLRRSMVLVGIGAIWGAGEIVSGVNQGGFNWGVLQALGVAILLTLPALLLPVKTRLLIGLLLLGTYQILLDWLWLEAVRSAPHGGLQGSLAWASMMLMATAIADLINGEIKPRRRGFLISLALLATGLLCGTWLIPISMHRVSASYVLITLGSAGLLYTLVRLIVDDCGKKLRPLSTWGRNPLLLYIIHGFLLALFVLPPFAWWHVQAPAWLVAIQIFVLLVIMHMIARALERRRWYLSA